MTRPFRLLLALLVIHAMTRPLQAQATPEAAARAAGEALKTSDWAAAARGMHPDALRQLHDLFEPLFRLPGADEQRAALLGVGSEAEFNATPDTILYANFLRNVIAQQQGLGPVLQTAVVTPLGHISGGGDTVLVVTRIAMSVEGVTITQFEVMPFLRYQGQWKGLLKADFTNMAAMIRRQVDALNGEPDQ